MAATCLFVIYFYQKSIKRWNHTNRGLPVIYINFFFLEKVLSIPTKDFPLGFETCFILILLIYLSKIYLRSCSNLLNDANPRLFSFPLRNSSILYYSSSIMYYFHYTPTKMQCGFEWNRAKDVESRASFLIE